MDKFIHVHCTSPLSSTGASATVASSAADALVAGLFSSLSDDSVSELSLESSSVCSGGVTFLSSCLSFKSPRAEMKKLICRYQSSVPSRSIG